MIQYTFLPHAGFDQHNPYFLLTASYTRTKEAQVIKKENKHE